MTLSKIGPIWTHDHILFFKAPHGISWKGRAITTTADAQFQIRMIGEKFIVIRDPGGEMVEVFETVDDAKAHVQAIYERESDR